MTFDGTIDYEFFAPQRIRFGWGSRREAGKLARSLGTRALIVSGSRRLAAGGLIDEIEASLREAGVTPLRFASISREPEVGDVDDAVTRLRALKAGPGDLVLAIGGGSAIDLAKAAAALAVNSEGSGVADYLEGVGRGLKITRPPLPLLAMPTTAGTGSEATKNAVISSYAPQFKKSLRSDLMIPKAVLVDPELTVGLPREITAHTGMDAVTQLIESYLSCRARPIPRALCVQGLQLALPALVEAVEQGSSRTARERMAHAALLSGLALANSGLGMAHGVAAALGVHCRVPHGLACAVMLPAALRANFDVCRDDLATLAAMTSTEAGASARPNSAQGFVDRIVGIAKRIGIPGRLSELGVAAEQIPAIVRSSRGNSMDGNPRPVSDAELTSLLEGML